MATRSCARPTEMSWVRLDDQFTDHPKVVEAGPMAAWLYVCGLTYCARQLTDGFVPSGQLRRLVPVAGVAKLAQRLVEVHLWETAPGGYRVHDYLIYNPTRQQTLALREQKASAGRKGGWQKAGNVLAERQASATTPVPIPQPVPIPSRPDGTASSPEHLQEDVTSEKHTQSALASARMFAVPKPGLPLGSSELALQRALASALNCAEPSTPSERKKWHPAITEMLHARTPVEAGEIPALVAAFEDRNTVPCTPQGIVNQLEQLRAPRPATTRSVPNGRRVISDPIADAKARIEARHADQATQRALA